ncbi:MAG: hypothetical protein JOZ95_05095 [Solirubrobacterales bacterium]|nr:hypothetical protein [Solirubrobacterales bacterium]
MRNFQHRLFTDERAGISHDYRAGISHDYRAGISHDYRDCISHDYRDCISHDYRLRRRRRDGPAEVPRSHEADPELDRTVDCGTGVQSDHHEQRERERSGQ